MVIDLGNTRYLSSRAVGVILAHYQGLERKGATMRVCGVSREIKPVLDQMRLSMLIDIYPTVEEAVQTPGNDRPGRVHDPPRDARPGPIASPERVAESTTRFDRLDRMASGRGRFDRIGTVEKDPVVRSHLAIRIPELIPISRIGFANTASVPTRPRPGIAVPPSLDSARHGLPFVPVPRSGHRSDPSVLSRRRPSLPGRPRDLSPTDADGPTFQVITCHETPDARSHSSCCSRSRLLALFLQGPGDPDGRRLAGRPWATWPGCSPPRPWSC